MQDKETIEQIKIELEKHRHKRKEIYIAIKTVDNMFSGIKDTCAKCRHYQQHEIHFADEGHTFIPSIFVGDLAKSEIVYSITNVCNISICNRGLRIDVEEEEDDNEEDGENSLPSSWYEEVRFEILDNLDTIIEGVLVAIQRQNDLDLQKFNNGINKIDRILQVLKEGEQ